MFINYNIKKYAVAHLNLPTASFKRITLLHVFLAYNL